MRRLAESEEALVEATLLLDRRELVAVPLDHAYAVAADALDEDAARALRDVAPEPFAIVVASIEEARHVAHVTPAARRLAAERPHGLRLRLRARGTAAEVLEQDGEVVVHVPASRFARDLAERFGPYASAFGAASARDADEAVAVALGAALVVDGGRRDGEAAAIVDAREDPNVFNPRALRPE